MAYRNMLLVSLEEYQNLRKQLLFNQAPALTQDLYKMKESSDHLPVDQQNILEGEVLRQHIKHSIPSLNQPAVPLPPLNDSIVTDHLSGFTKLNKQRAQQIYQHLKAYNVRWNELGQLLNLDNTPIPGSNIVELIDYVTNTSKSARQPAGFSDFITMLENSQLPRHYLSSKGETRIEKHKQSHVKSQDEQNVIDTQPPESPTWTIVTRQRRRRK